jgi:trehalose 6-phosphate phosphatase
MAIPARRTRSVYGCVTAAGGRRDSIGSVTPDPVSTFAAAAPGAGIFCDFDGCLSPIVADPDAARPVRGAATALAACAKKYRVVAIVSGRSVADLGRRIEADGVLLIGLHGMEELRDGRVRVSPEAEAARSSVERAASLLERELAAAPGAILERKGLALAVHFRRAEDPALAERLAAPIVERAAAAEGLRVVPGRRILEVRPAAGGDKGDAVRRLIERESLGAAMVAGDDVGDVPAFRALEGIGTRLRVAVAGDESPPELAASADVVVRSPREFVALLKRLV